VLFFFIPWSGGADSQFAQTWNRYGRGMVDICREAREMKDDGNGGILPQTCSRGVIVINVNKTSG
jgi:hypothetical protein